MSLTKEVHNPSAPLVYLRFRRDGEEMLETVYPSRLEYISSVEASDMLRITIPDAEYRFIDHPMLIEDLRTEVEFSFGYSHDLSPKGTLLFFRQSPAFTSEGVTTTITCFDKGLFLTMPLGGYSWESDSGVGVEEILKDILEEVNKVFDAGLTLETRGHSYDPNTFTRIQMTDDSTPMEFIFYVLRNVKSQNKPTELLAEVFVRDNHLIFAPPNRDRKPVAHYRYFGLDGKEGGIYSGRLLSFEPEVNLYPSSRQVVADVDPQTAQVVEAEGGIDDNPMQTTFTAGTNIIDGSFRRTPSAGSGQRRERDVEIKRVDISYVTEEGDTLESVAEKYNVSKEAIMRESSLDSEEIKIGMSLIVPQVEREKLTSEELRTLAIGEYLMYQNEAVRARARVMGDPALRAGWPADFSNVGRKWQGRWYIKEVTHTIDAGGYLCDLDLSREGFYVVQGENRATGGVSTNLDDEPQSAEDQEQRFRQTNIIDGANRAVSR